MKRFATALLASSLLVSPVPAMFAMVPADRVDEVPIERLFLDAAGEFFNKPGTFRALCPPES